MIVLTNRLDKKNEIDLGLAISGATLPHGQFRELKAIAAFCGCSTQMIHLIEKRALSKIRQAIETKLKYDEEWLTS